MVPVVGGVVLNFAKSVVLQKALSLGADTLKTAIRGGVSARSTDRLLKDSLNTDDSPSRSLLVYSRFPNTLKQDAEDAASKLNGIGGVGDAKAIIKAMSLSSGVCSIALAISTSFAKDHKAILKSVAPGFESATSKILTSTASLYDRIPKTTDLLADKKLWTGIKNGNVDTINTLLSSIMPRTIATNSGLVGDQNARVDRKFGSKPTTSPVSAPAAPAPKNRS